MGYADGIMRKYLDDAAANLPAPGGGSIAACIGALGASMSSMVANFTIGKKKYAGVEEDVKKLLDAAETEREKLTELIDADVKAYGGVSEAYGMPRETDEQKAERSEAIREACKGAMAVPMDIARSVSRLAVVCEKLVEIGNPNLITDVGVSVLAADAACSAAALNVQINLGSIGDESAAKQARGELDSILKQMEKTKELVMTKVKEAL